MCLAQVQFPHSANGGENEKNVPLFPMPRVRKRKTKSQRNAKNKANTNWISERKSVAVKQAFEEGVGVVHDLPVGASPFKFFILLMPQRFYVVGRH